MSRLLGDSDSIQLSSNLCGVAWQVIVEKMGMFGGLQDVTQKLGFEYYLYDVSTHPHTLLQPLLVFASATLSTSFTCIPISLHLNRSRSEDISPDLRSWSGVMGVYFMLKLGS